jgi:hypothetical protein
MPRNVNLGNGRFAMFNKERDISSKKTHPPCQASKRIVDSPVSLIPHVEGAPRRISVGRLSVLG